jgi:glycosyltransferase involved in cell wall biosynthesis
MNADGFVATIAIVTWRREALLRRCLDSLGPPPRGVEMLLLFNGDDSEDAAQRAATRWPWLRVTRIPRAPRGEARNRAVAEARGRFIHFLDDDVFADPGFAGRLLEAIARHPHAPCLGGPNLGPRGASPFQRAVDFVLRSPLGAGPMRTRYLASARERVVPGWSLMLCNLGFRRDLFYRPGLRFPPSTASAEENLLLHRIERAAGSPVHCPELSVYHERRADARGFARQVYLSGVGRAQISRLEPRSFHPAALAPAALGVYLAAWPWLPAAWASWPAAAYGLGIALETARLALIERDPAAAARLPALFPLAHLSYALGLAAGLFTVAEDA